MRWLKQLFCSHIWEIIEDKDLKKGENKYYWSIPAGRFFDEHWKYYARHQKCVKCQKDKFMEITKKSRRE